MELVVQARKGQRGGARTHGRRRRRARAFALGGGGRGGGGGAPLLNDVSVYYGVARGGDQIRIEERPESTQRVQREIVWPSRRPRALDTQPPRECQRGRQKVKRPTHGLDMHRSLTNRVDQVAGCGELARRAPRSARVGARRLGISSVAFECSNGQTSRAVSRARRSDARPRWLVRLDSRFRPATVFAHLCFCVIISSSFGVWLWLIATIVFCECDLNQIIGPKRCVADPACPQHTKRKDGRHFWI